MSITCERRSAAISLLRPNLIFMCRYSYISRSFKSSSHSIIGGLDDASIFAKLPHVIEKLAKLSLSRVETARARTMASLQVGRNIETKARKTWQTQELRDQYHSYSSIKNSHLRPVLKNGKMGEKLGLTQETY